MAEAPLSLEIEYFNDPDTGKPISNGKIYIGNPDTDPTVLGNRVTVVVVQEDGTRVNIAPAAQPLRTGANGRVQYLGEYVSVRVADSYSLAVHSSTDVQKYYNPRANESADASAEGVILLNGSFEFETQFSGAPDNWTLTPGTNGTVAIDSSDQAHGLKSLKFTGTDATGGGVATSDKFNVLKNGTLNIYFTYKSSAANTLNLIQIRYFNAADGIISSTNVLNEGSANPTSYTSYVVNVTIPATAVRAELKLTGVSGSGTTVAGSTNFDDIYIEPLFLDPTFRAHVSSSYTHTTNNVVQFDTEDFDETSDYDNATYRFQPSRPGKYMVFASVYLQSTTTGYYGDLLMKKNGVTQANTTDYTAANDITLKIFDIVEFNGTTDYVEITCAAVGTLTVGSLAGGARSYFEAFRVQD